MGLVTAWRRAGSPTTVSPLSVNATTLGVRRFPSALGITFTSLPSITATTELVVPRSIPMIFSPLDIRCSFLEQLRAMASSVKDKFKEQRMCRRKAIRASES